MQIMIEMPEKEYQNVIHGKWEGNPLANYIEDGTPLPNYGFKIDAATITDIIEYKMAR